MTRCPACPGKHRCLGPHGDPRSPYLFVGEAPGKQEDRQGIPFVGKTGDELNRGYLPLAGLTRHGIRVMNAIACLPDRPDHKITLAQAKDRALVESCAATHLYPHIEATQPKVIVAMGAFACHALGLGIDLEVHHGIPTTSAWGIPVFPMYHPATGLHEPKRMLLLRNDWMRLRQFLAGTLVVPADSFPTPDYTEITHVSQLTPDLADPTLPLACDTETTRDRAPFCLTFSTTVGTGRLIRADRPDLLAAFQRALNIWQGPILFHNLLFDIDVVGAMGLRFPRKRLVDTMVLVYHLGNLPQGLKALAFRELGMTMQDFDDVVTPHSRPLVLDYYLRAAARDWPKPEAQLVLDPETRQLKVYQPQSMKTKLKRFFTDYFKAPDTKDVFAAWGNWEDRHGEIEATCGPWPGKCITHVPFEDALFYACRDADALLRLWGVIQRVRRDVRKRPQQDWGRVA